MTFYLSCFPFCCCDKLPQQKARSKEKNVFILSQCQCMVISLQRSQLRNLKPPGTYTQGRRARRVHGSFSYNHLYTYTKIDSIGDGPTQSGPSLSTSTDAIKKPLTVMTTAQSDIENSSMRLSCQVIPDCHLSVYRIIQLFLCSLIFF